LDDVAIEVDLTPNRADCLSIAGLAREVGVLNRCDVVAPEIEAVEPQCQESFPIRVMPRKLVPVIWRGL